MEDIRPGSRSSADAAHAVLNALPQPSWVLSLTGKCEYVNDAWTKYTGIGALQGQAEGWLRPIHTDDCPQVLKALERAESGAAEVECRLQADSGTYEWFRIHIAALELSGERAGLLATALPIEIQKSVDEHLQRQREHLAIAQRAANAGFWRWHLSEGRGVMTDECRRLMNMPEKEIYTREEVLEAVHPDDRELVHEAAVDSVRTGEVHIEFRVPLAAGGVRWISAQASRSDDETGVYLAGINIDITERKLAEEVMRRTEKLAAAGRLAATVAHEINNPLEAVTNLLYLAQNSGSLDANTQQYLSSAEEELKRVAHIVRQTLGFYRDTSAPRATNLSHLLEDLLALYGKRMQMRGIELQTGFPGETYAVVVPSEIKQVVANLIANAIDAMPEGGRLSLTLEGAGDEALITVRDSGTGISDVARQHLFEPFFTTKRDVGTGLGLWVSRQIVEKHGGHITLTTSSAPDSHGTEFVVALPLHREKPSKSSSDR